MKKLFLIFVLAFLACFVQAQMPIFRNQFTTNVPGAYVRGPTTFSGLGTWWNGLTSTGLSTFVGPMYVSGPAGTSSVSIGFQALTNAEFSTAVGSLAGQHATLAVHGTFLGRSAGQWITNAESPTAVGANAALRAYNANQGTFLGAYAGLRAFDATNATMVGRSAGLYASNTAYATFVGHQAGRYATNAPFATFLGAHTGPDASINDANIWNSVAIGYNAKVTSSNQFILGTGQRVGINTNAPTTHLEVHGSIRSTNFQLIKPLWDDVRIPVSSLSSPSSQPGRVTYRGGLTVYGFDDASTEQLSFELQWPHGLDTNNAYGIRIHLHWTATNAIAGANSNVVWGMEYSWANPFQAFNTTTITNLYTNGLIAPHIHCIVPMVTITNIKESGVLIGRLFREGGNGGDTFAGDALGISLDAHYPRLQMGSHGEFGDF